MGGTMIRILDLKAEFRKWTSMRGRIPQMTEVDQRGVGPSATLHTMTEDGPKSHAASVGMIVIVPQGTWHRFHSPEGKLGDRDATADRVSDRRCRGSASALSGAAVEHHRGEVALNNA